MKAIVTNIKWDTDGDDIHLPQELVVSIDKDICKEFQEVDDFVSDAISDMTGWCHKGFDMRLIK